MKQGATGSRWLGALGTAGGWAATLFAGLALVYVLGVARAPDLPSQAPGFALQDLDGAPVQLEALRGRPVLLNFWATWCGPCRVEIPAFSRFAESNPDITVLGIVAPEPVDALRTAAAELGVTYRVAVADEATLAAYGITTFPTTVVVDREGNVVTSHTGIMLDPQLWWATREL